MDLTMGTRDYISNNSAPMDSSNVSVESYYILFCLSSSVISVSFIIVTFMLFFFVTYGCHWFAFFVRRKDFLYMFICCNSI
jgi:hypothetical protein